MKYSLSSRDMLRKWFSRFMIGVIVLCVFIALAPLFSVFSLVVSKGLSGIDLAFFTHLPRPVGELGGGMANAILGTIGLVLLGGIVGIPWGLAVGVYLSEYSRNRMATPIRFVCNLLASTPSIIVGLFAYAVFVMPMKRFSALAGAASLAIIMIPMMARTSEEILRLVPNHIREAGLALGIPRWKVVLMVIVKGSLGSLATAMVLAVARVAGETAPLLFTAFNNPFWPKGLTQPVASLPVQIYTYAISPFDEWHRLAWTGALVLVALVFVLNLGTRILLGRKAQTKY